MSQAEELLNSLTEDGEVEEHIVIGKDRFITVPQSLKKIAVQYDNNVRTVTFDCPRHSDGRDLSTMTILVNYMRPDGEPGQYSVDNVTIDETDDTLIHFDWVIKGHVTEVNGTLSFLVCAKKTNTDGSNENHWNSELNQDMTVSKGLDCNSIIIEKYPDLITQILTRLDNVEKREVTHDDIEKALGDNITELKKRGSVLVSEEAPTSEDVQLWVDENESEEFSVPEIKDNEENSSDTWSSSKIAGEISELKGDLVYYDKDLKLLYSTWVQGGVNESGTYYVSTRIRTNYVAINKRKLTIIPQNGYQAYLVEFIYVDGSYTSNGMHGWYSEKSEIVFNNNSTHYIIAVRKGTGSEDIAPDEHSNLLFAESTNISDKIDNICITPQMFGAVCDGVTDDTNAVLSAVARIKELGGGTLLFPPSNNRMRITSTIEIDFGNICIKFGCDVFYDNSEPSDFFFIHGDSKSRIKGVGIYSNGNSIIGNADLIADDSEDTGNCMNIRYCDNVMIRDVVFTKGSANGLNIAFCKKIEVSNCEFSFSKHNNGCNIGSNAAYTENMECVVSNCCAHGNADFGFTSFDAVGVSFVDCHSYENGSNSDLSDTESGASGGGFSVEWYQENQSLPRVHTNNRMVRCIAEANISTGFFITADGTVIDNCKANSTVKPTLKDGYEDNGRYGSGIFAYCDEITISKTECNTNGLNGIRIVLDGESLGTFMIKDTTCNKNGNYGIGINGSAICYIDRCILRLNEYRGFSYSGNSENSILNLSCVSERNYNSNIYIDGCVDAHINGTKAKDGYYQISQASTSIAIYSVTNLIIDNTLSIRTDGLFASTTGLYIDETVENAIINGLSLVHCVLNDNAVTKKGLYRLLS